jgi:transcriptional regulator with XRE-family HTH domain
MTSGWSYAEALSAKIKQGRAGLRLSQKGLADRMDALGFGWRQQAVADVENGDRRLLAEELLGLALALETTLQEFLSLSEGDWEKPVTLPSEQTVSSDFVTSLVYGMNGGSVRWKGGKPEFGPVTQRTSNYSLRFVEIMRQQARAQPVQLGWTDAAGSAVTITMPPGLPDPGGS